MFKYDYEPNEEKEGEDVLLQQKIDFEEDMLEWEEKEIKKIKASEWDKMDFKQQNEIYILWVNKNIISEATKAVECLENNGVISCEDIWNYWEDEDEEQPQQISDWYLVTEEAYHKFQLIGYPVLDFNNIYFWGKTEAIFNIWSSSSNTELKIILNSIKF